MDTVVILFGVTALALVGWMSVCNERTLRQRTAMREDTHARNVALIHARRYSDLLKDPGYFLTYSQHLFGLMLFRDVKAMYRRAGWEL